MKSKVLSEILKKIPQETKDLVDDYANKLVLHNKENDDLMSAFVAGGIIGYEMSEIKQITTAQFSYLEKMAEEFVKRYRNN